VSARIDYLIFFVADLERSIAFYRDVLGFEFKFSEHGYAEFALDNLKFGLYERARLPDLIGRDAVEGGPASEIVVVVEDCDAETERVSAAGAELLSPPADRPWGHRTAHIADPDGNVIELAEEIPRP
jgi:lactoylglutathione lyase